jgi:hypothetical protein
MSRTSFFTALMVTIAFGVTLAPFDALASKEKFTRVKPHVNIGSSGLDGISVKLEGPGGDQASTTNEHGLFWFVDLEPGTYRLSVGSLSDGDYPPDPIRLKINYKAFPPDPILPKKPKEIVVVGSSTAENNSNDETIYIELVSMDLGPTLNPLVIQVPPKGPSSDSPSNIDSDHGGTTPAFDAFMYMKNPRGGGGTSASGSDHKQWVDISSMGGPDAIPDSFFDIWVEISEDEIQGSIEFLSPDLENTLGKIDIPDRPEILERPDAPDRPTR